MQKRDHTRKTILEAYVDLLDTTDFNKVSVKALCAKADIVRSTFYTYFDDIYDVIQEVEDSLMESFVRMDAEVTEQVRTDTYTPPSGKPADELIKTDWGFPLMPPPGFDEWFVCCVRNKAALAAMLGPHGDPYFEDKLRRQLASHVEMLMDRDGMPSDELRRWFVDVMVDLHVLLIKNWMTKGGRADGFVNTVAVLNTLRVGGNTIGHYIGNEEMPLPAVMAEAMKKGDIS